MGSQQPQQAQGLPNPYLPNPYLPGGRPNLGPATVVSAPPVKFTEEQARAASQKKTAFHNPHAIKRPQPKKASEPVRRLPMPVPASSSSSDPAPATHSRYEDWTSSVDQDAAQLEYVREKNRADRQRKKDAKKARKNHAYWDVKALHSVDRPTNLKAYKGSGRHRRKRGEFTEFLKGIAAKARAGKDTDVSEGSAPIHPASSKSPTETAEPTVVAKPSFAPPTSYDDPVAAPSDSSGEEAYAQRMRLSQQASYPLRLRLRPHGGVCAASAPGPPPASVASTPTSYQGATISAPPVRYSATISAPPVRYDRPDVSMGAVNAAQANDERPAKRPKIQTKAEAMMAKMGYKKGQGLGKNNDGVVTHLEVKKRKAPQGASIFDDEGGTTNIKAQIVWDVTGGMRKQTDEPDKFGEKSSVVVTWGCVEDVDWDANAMRDDGGIRQDMGEAFGTKFGPVERIYLDQNNSDGVVYIHFKDVLSALNAINRFDEGWEFKGRKIRAKYYDERKFHAGVFDY
ncbi:hypothetical protein N0V83_008816 [Neocucurbitaria cava]|uniref:G-patch domain-containing protein n=1 Tax=Neocucurbitaria cava TaxID=798079 RepID=A0A9W8Y309_9PLEO|nr:hypothetical protein N0V83_008816 [Neocucurbitaria cava]